MLDLANLSFSKKFVKYVSWEYHPTLIELSSHNWLFAFFYHSVTIYNSSSHAMLITDVNAAFDMISDMITRYDNAKTDMRAIIDCNTDYTLNMNLFGAYKEIIKRRFIIYRAKKDLYFVKEKIKKMIDGCDDDSKFLCLITVIHKIYTNYLQYCSVWMNAMRSTSYITIIFDITIIFMKSFANVLFNWKCTSTKILIR